MRWYEWLSERGVVDLEVTLETHGNHTSYPDNWQKRNSNSHFVVWAVSSKSSCSLCVKWLLLSSLLPCHDWPLRLDVLLRKTDFLFAGFNPRLVPLPIWNVWGFLLFPLWASRFLKLMKWLREILLPPSVWLCLFSFVLSLTTRGFNYAS